MLARIRKATEEKDQGFTLIELLVVMIIIGILAAIAIPVFLNQRQNGYRSAVQTDLRNAATAIESWAVGENGMYTNLAAEWTAGNIEFNGSTAVTITAAAAHITDTTYCISAVHSALDSTEVWSFTKATGSPVQAAC